MSNKFCWNCGAAIAEGQAFCSGCGKPVEAPMVAETDAPTPEGQASVIDAFNANVVQQQKKKGNLKKLLMFGIPIAVILIIVLSKFVGGGFKEGTYQYVTTKSETTYKFEDGKYTYTTEDDTETGNYEVDGKEATITDEDGDKTIFVQYGEYLYNKNSHYKQEIPKGDTFTQTITVNNKLTVKGKEYDLGAEWNFSKDGTYTWESTLGSGGYSSTVSEMVGTYRREGDLLLLKPNDEDYERVYLVIDGLMYYSVYKVK